MFCNSDKQFQARMCWDPYWTLQFENLILQIIKWYQGLITTTPTPKIVIITPGSVWSGKPVIVTWKRCKSAPETFRESPLRSLLWPSPFLHHCRHHHHHHHHHHFDLISTNRKYTIAILILTLTFSTSNTIFPFAASHHESLKETWAKSLQVICWPRKYKRLAWK